MFLRQPIIATLLLLSCIAGYPQNDNTLSGVRRERMDSLFNVMEENNLFNGSVLISEKGKIIYKRSGGYAVMETKIPNSDTTPVNTASVSKSFTSLAILQLVEKQKVDLEAPVNRYLTDFPFPEIKIRHLMSHFSGLPRPEDFEREYIKAHPLEVLTNETVYKHFLQRKDTLTSRPGDRFGYNNLNYVLLAMIIEKVSGLPFPEYMRKNIFFPAGMKKSFIRQPHQRNTPRYVIPGAWESNYVSVDSLDHLRYNTYYNLGAVWGPGNVISTLQDLHKFDEALKKGKLLSTAVLRKAFEVPILNNGTLFLGPSKRTYGLGWNIFYNQYGDTCVFHDGNIPGMNTMLYKNLTKDQTIFWYTNAESPAFFQKIYSIANVLNGQPTLQLLKMGKKKSVVQAYAKILVKEGIDLAAIRLNELMADTANYFMNELEMNSLGYDLHFKPTFAGHNELSLEVLKINTLLYKSANSFDSYGDVLMNTGKTKEAILAYKRSLELNPNNENAKKNLVVLQKGSN